MQYDFEKASGAFLINQVVTFLKKNKVIPMIPKLEDHQKQVMYFSEELVITFYSIKRNHGYFEIRENVNGIPRIVRTTIFLCI